MPRGSSIEDVALERDILRDELEEARNLVTFLHGCLTAPDSYSYAYPEQTEEALKRWDAQWPLSPACVHSTTDPGCPSCVQRLERFARHDRWLEAAGAL